LQGLYELSVWIARYWELDEPARKRARRNLMIVIVMLTVGVLFALWQWHPGFHAWAQRLIS
jgi:hypothetical protein